MDINKYQGSKAEQIGNLLHNLHRRIEQLETADRLTRTHPVSPLDDDFQGTVISSQIGVEGSAVFVVSRDGGLESPPQQGALVQEGLTPAMDINTIEGLGYQLVSRWQFVGTYADAVQLQMDFDVSTLSTTWAIDMRLRSGVVGAPLSSEIISDAMRFSPTENTGFVGFNLIGNTGDWVWRHGQPIHTEQNLYVELEIQLTNPGSEILSFNLLTPGADPVFDFFTGRFIQAVPALIRGARMRSDFDPAVPYLGTA